MRFESRLCHLLSFHFTYLLACSWASDLILLSLRVIVKGKFNNLCKAFSHTQTLNRHAVIVTIFLYLTNIY